MTDDKMREAFEKWYLTDIVIVGDITTEAQRKYLFRLNDLGAYENREVNKCWLTWINATEEANRQHPKWCEYCQKDTHNDAECWCTRPVGWKPEAKNGEIDLSACEPSIANRQAEIVQEPVAWPELPKKEGFTPSKGGRYVFGVGQAYAYGEEQMKQYALELLAKNAPPSTEALVAVAYQKAAEVCVNDKYMVLDPLRTYTAQNICDAKKSHGESLKNKILALTPQDAQQALDDMLMAVALEVRHKQSELFTNIVTNEELRDIIAKVKGKS